MKDTANAAHGAFGQYTPYLIFAFIAIVLFIVLYTAWLTWQNKLMRQMAESGVLLEVLLEKDTETNHLSVEQMWSSFYSGLFIPWYRRMFKPQPYITFEIKSEHLTVKSKKEITFNFWVPESYKSMIKQRIIGLYSKAQVKELSQDYIPTLEDRLRVVRTTELGLASDSAFSIRLFKDFEADPLSSITSAMSDLEDKEVAVIQIALRPLPPSWKRRAEKTLIKYEKTGRMPSKLPEWSNVIGAFFGFFFKIIGEILNTIFASKPPEIKVETSKSSLDSQKQKEMLEKVTRNPFAFQIRVMVASPFGSDEADEKVRNIVASFKELDGPNNHFKKEFLFRKNVTHKRMLGREFSVINNDDVLTTVELAGFAHLPNKTNYTPGLKKIQSKRTEFPADVATEDAFAVAMDTFGNERPVGLDEDGRMRHIYVSGMTGVNVYLPLYAAMRIEELC